MRTAASEAPVGVLALQGDFARHAAALARPVREVRRPDDLAGLRALVLPGGESTTMRRLLGTEDLFDPVRAFAGSGAPVLATCAGLILLARDLGALDVDLERNGYGPQIASGVFEVDGEPAVFIRAPRIVRVGPRVEVLARRDTDPVLVRQGPVVAATFHPELMPRGRAYALFTSAVA